VSPQSPARWSLIRSLAFLAATFAIAFGSLLPAAVAASPAIGQPVVLCSGERGFVARNDDGGSPAPTRDADTKSLSCAAALMAGLAAIATPPPVAAAFRPVPARPAPLRPTARAGLGQPAPRPPSTAPPLS